MLLCQDRFEEVSVVRVVRVYTDLYCVKVFHNTTIFFDFFMVPSSLGDGDGTTA